MGITSAQCQRHRRGAALAPFAAEYTPGPARPGAVLSAPRRGVFCRSYAGDPAPERFAAHAVTARRPAEPPAAGNRAPGPGAVGPIPPEMAVLPVEDQETLDLSPEARQRVEITATRSARSRSGRRPARTARCPRRRRPPDLFLAPSVWSHIESPSVRQARRGKRTAMGCNRRGAGPPGAHGRRARCNSAVRRARAPMNAEGRAG